LLVHITKTLRQIRQISQRDHSPESQYLSATVVRGVLNCRVWRLRVIDTSAIRQ